MDRISPEARSAAMRAIRSQGMKPELAIRRLVHGMGYRYRLHRKDLPGRPDLAFPGRQKVIFVHGCFWHQHPDPACKLAHKPKSNLSYWQPKLKRNQERDAASQAKLREMGWDTMVIWECEIGRESGLVERIRAFLEEGQDGNAP